MANGNNGRGGYSRRNRNKVTKPNKTREVMLKSPRGRPPGKNRIALSDEERKQRNRHYEYLRRQEQSYELQNLADAVGLDGNTKNMKKVLEAAAQFIAETANCAKENIKLKEEISDLQSNVNFTEDVLRNPDLNPPELLELILEYAV